MSILEYVLNQYVVFFMWAHEYALQTGTFTGIENMLGIDTFAVVSGGVGVGYTIMYQIHQAIIEWWEVYKLKAENERNRKD